MKTFHQAALFVCLLALTAGRISAQTVLYESQPDFPDFVTGNLAGQDGWESALSYSTNAAQIVSYTAGQALELFGPFVAQGGPSYYSSSFSQPLSSYNAVSAGTPIISVSADMWMNLGPTASNASWLYGFLILTDPSGNAYASIGIDKNGVIFGQNFASPNQVASSTNTATNTFHVLRADHNFTTRTVSFYVDNYLLGSMPFNPSAGTLAGSVTLILQSSDPVDSNLLLDNLSVTAGTGIPAGGCSLQIASPVGPCLSSGVAGDPNVGDIYGLKVTLNVTGTPYQPFRIKYTIGNVTYYSGYLNGITAGSGWWYYFLWWINLDGQLPWSVTLDPDGVSGSTNLAEMTASGTFTPAPPSAPLELYDSVTVGGTEEWDADFEPGSGTISDLYVVFGSPTTHGAQSVFSVSAPSNSASIVTAPYGVPVRAVGWTNPPPGSFQESESFTAELSAMRVNPALLRTNTWAQMSALPTNITAWLAPDPVCQSTSPIISNFVQLYLPANYKTTMTPYDTARVLHGAVARSLIYLEPPPYGDATNSLQAGLADCGGYASLLTAALRVAGIPARRIAGFWQGDCWQNDSQWHVRTEYYLPDTGWLITDSCEANQADPSGMYSWDFSFAPDANDYFAIDVGDQHILPYGNFTDLQVANWLWYGDATYNSGATLSYLQPLGSVCVSNIVGGSMNLSVTNAPSLGTVFLQSSTNLTDWKTIATNTATGDPLTYSYPMAGTPRKFFRELQIP